MVQTQVIWKETKEKQILRIQGGSRRKHRMPKKDKYRTVMWEGVVGDRYLI